ncbi:tetratricopeptide repeat protein [Gemmatimonadota bacterium]
MVKTEEKEVIEYELLSDVELTEHAELGDVVAQSILADRYFGFGESDKDAKSYYWYRKAAEQDDANAQYMVAFMLQIGCGIEQNEEQAFRWYYKAAMNDQTDSYYAIAKCYALGIGVEKDEERAYPYLMLACCFNDPLSLIQRGLMSLYGWYPVKQNMNEALEWILKAAKCENKLALIALGTMYAKGLGVEKNNRKASNYYRKAARFGCPCAKNFTFDKIGWFDPGISYVDCDNCSSACLAQDT